MKSIYLNANENPYNTINKESVAKSISDFDFNRYPDSKYLRLRKILGKINSINEENIITTNGSDELIQLIILAFSKENQKILSLEPTFSEYKKISNYLNRNYIGIKPNKDLSFNKENAKESILKEKPEIVFLCSPNNPTGELLDINFIESILKNSNSLIVLDEAYIEFEGDTNIKLIEKYDNLVIMRTLSKAYGLASLRIGYGISSNSIISKLNNFRMPYNISGISEYIASKTLENLDINKYKEAISNEKVKIKIILKELNIDFLKSYSNFILFKTNNNDYLYERLLKNNIVIRKFDTDLLDNYLRFSVGTPEENNKFISILKEAI